MPLCHDRELIRPLLLEDEPGTRGIYNLVFGLTGARVGWIRVDDLKKPRAVIIRSGAPRRGGFLYLFATSNRTAESLLAELPGRWKLRFAATSRRFVRSVRKFRKINWTGPCYLYVLDPKKLVICRQHRVERLRPADAPAIARHWPHGRSVAYVQWRIAVGPTCAVRRNGKLVAWALTHADGSMAILHVLEEYRGQGMARSITTALAQRIMKRGLMPFLYIVKRNKASICLTESMGFERHGNYCWFGE